VVFENEYLISYVIKLFSLIDYRFCKVVSEEEIPDLDLEHGIHAISESDYGTHALIIYQSLERLRDFYSYYVKIRIEDKNEVIQLAPFYETVDSVRKILSEGKQSLTDIKKIEEEEKSLNIIDSMQKYTELDSPQSDNDFTKIW
jgi:hypothetical protein